MEHESKKQDKTTEMALKVADELIGNYTPAEQRQFLHQVEQNIRENYQNQIISAQKHAEGLKYNFDEFMAVPASGS
jgi:hypothetical protein